MANVNINPQKKQFNSIILEISPEQNLMTALLDHGLPVASSCKGDGVCGKCRITILSGMNHLSAETELELSLRKKKSIKS